MIAEDLNCATTIAKKYSYRFKIVTLDGQVVNDGGSLTGGSLNRNTGLLSRANEIETLKKQTAVLEQKSKDAENRSIEISREYSAFEAQLLGSRADLSNLRQDLVRLEAEKRACDNELANAGASVENSMNEITNCRQRIETLEKDKNSAKQLLVELNKKILAAEEKVNELTGSRAELTKKREEISLQLQNLRLEIVSSQKDIDALNSDIVFAKSTGNENLERKAELNQEVADLANDELKRALRKSESSIHISNSPFPVEETTIMYVEGDSAGSEVTRDRPAVNNADSGCCGTASVLQTGISAGRIFSVRFHQRSQPVLPSRNCLPRCAESRTGAGTSEKLWN